MGICYCSLLNELMIYLQPTLWCCEKSLAHSYSLFIGTQKNKYKVYAGVEGGQLLLRKTPVGIHVVNSSPEVNVACRK